MSKPDYYRDPDAPLAGCDAEQLYRAFGYGRARVAAWLAHHFGDDHPTVGHAVEMRGHFTLGFFNNHSWTWTFTPGLGRARAVVLPVFEQRAIVDLVAISKHESFQWGCVLGVGRFLGRVATCKPLRVHRRPTSWLRQYGDGVVPLANYAMPDLRQAPTLIAEDYEHAWDLAHRVFINPTLDDSEMSTDAKQEAFDRIVIDASEQELLAESRRAA